MPGGITFFVRGFNKEGTILAILLIIISNFYMGGDEIGLQYVRCSLKLVRWFTSRLNEQRKQRRSDNVVIITNVV